MRSLNLAKQLRDHIENALDCRSRGMRYVFRPSALSIKYYAVPLATYWGERLPEEYKDPHWLSVQPIAFQRLFWSAYFGEGVEVAVKTIWKVNGEIIQKKPKYSPQQTEASMEKCFKKMERLEIEGLTFAEVCGLFPSVSEKIVREGLLTICAFKTWSAVKSDHIYFSKARA